MVERFYGSAGELPCKVWAKLSRRVTNQSGSRSYIRVRVVEENGEYVVEPLMLTGSGLLSTITKANPMRFITEDVEGFDEGEQVEVEFLQNIE